MLLLPDSAGEGRGGDPEWGREARGANRTIGVGGSPELGLGLLHSMQVGGFAWRCSPGCQLQFTHIVVSDYALWVGIVTGQTCLPSGTSQPAEGMRGPGPRLPGQVLLAAPASGEASRCCCSAARRSSAGSVCPGLLGTSSEGVGGCECALKVLTATLLVTRIPRKLILSRSDRGETLPRA